MARRGELPCAEQRESSAWRRSSLISRRKNINFYDIDYLACGGKVSAGKQRAWTFFNGRFFRSHGGAMSSSMAQSADDLHFGHSKHDPTSP